MLKTVPPISYTRGGRSPFSGFGSRIGKILSGARRPLGGPGQAADHWWDAWSPEAKLSGREGHLTSSHGWLS
jgi:hypothetical protein